MNSYRNVLSFKDMLEYHDDCNPSGIYYHYTSVDAFKSIMESMQLRLTRYDRMTKGDDEGKEAVRVAIDILEGLEEEKVITHSLCEKVVVTIQSDMDESFTRFYLECGKRVPCIPYVILRRTISQHYTDLTLHRLPFRIDFHQELAIIANSSS